MPTLLDTYTSERDDLLATIQRTLEGVEGRDLSDAETRSIGDARARVESLNAQIDLVSGAADLTRNLGRSERRQRAASSEVRSIGEQFAESDILANYRGGRSSVFEARALPTSTTDIADLLPQPSRRVDITAPTVTPLLDSLAAIGVSGGSIETVVWAATGAPAVVAEGSPKPSVEYTPTVTPYSLDTIAGYTQMTRQMLEDAPAVRDKINSMLMRDVALKMEAEAAGAIAGATLPTATSDSLIKAIRLGVGTVQDEGYFPNVVILNPADWAALDIDVFGSTLNGPIVGQSFWGLRPIAASSQAAGTATVADLSAGVEHYRRSGVGLYVTDSHGDTFLSNVFTVLAEARSKTLVVRPAALVDCSVA